MAQLLHLESEDPRCDVATTCLGWAASAAAVILAAGAPGKRYALPHSTVLLHQPSGGAQGQSVDIDIQAREILRLRGWSTRSCPTVRSSPP